MIHLLSITSSSTGNAVTSILLWIERSARLLGVLTILGIFLAKNFSGKHVLEILILLILGVWFVPSIVPPKASAVIASMNTGGSAGATGVSWGMLALLVALVAIVVYAYK